MPSGSRVRFLIVSDDSTVEGYLRREFKPCAASRTCSLSAISLQAALTGGLPRGPWDILMLAAGNHTGPYEAQRLLALATGARLLVVTDADAGEDRRRAFLSAGASAVMNRAAAAAGAFGGRRPCTIWRRRQTEFLLRLRSRMRTLRELERRRGDFLADVFHELRSPLTVVSASIRLLLEDAEKYANPERLSLTKMAERNSAHMLHRVLTILDRARLESSVIHAERSAIDLEALAVAAKDEFLSIVGRPLTMAVRIRRPLPPAFADRVMVEQIFSNLLNNAARFARSKVTIALRSRPQEGFVLVSVIDDGPGLEPGKAEHIFERFLQGPRPSGTGYKGMGLGLGICRDLLALNGGRIWTGTRRGGGGRFYFTLPIAVPAAPEASHGEVSLGR